MSESPGNKKALPEAFDLVWSSLAEQPFFGVYLLQDGRFLYVNERFAQILGYPSVDEVMQLPSVLDTVYEADRDMVRENIRARLEGEVGLIRYSLRGRRKDGSPVELEVQGQRVMHNGRPAIVGVQCDVSERAREQRTYHARKKAEALGAMAAGVAHDFNNILAAVGTTAELMAAQASAAEVARDVADIREAVDRGSRLCKRLMSFGSEGRESERTAALGAVLTGLMPILERLLKSRKVRLSVHAPEGLPPVRIQSVEVEQIVMNLVVNAADASPERGEVTVRAAVDESSGERRVLLEVRDHGTGIAPEHMARIFEPYFTTKGDNGNGLGLRNVWQIVTTSGGEVKVASTVGEGSTFSIFLPIERRQTPRIGPTQGASFGHAWQRRAPPMPGRQPLDSVEASEG